MGRHSAEEYDSKDEVTVVLSHRRSSDDGWYIVALLAVIFFAGSVMLVWDPLGLTRLVVSLLSRV